MNYSLGLFLALFALYMSVLLVSCEIAKNQEHNKNFQVLDKDVKDAKERWIQNDEDLWDDDMMQHPIDEGPRRTNRELGEMCTYSHDCQSGCCQLERKSKIRSCQPKAVFGEKCTNAQVKADTYVDYCPCMAGYDACVFPKEVCTK